MHAIICPAYGPPEVLQQAERPMLQVKPDTLLVRIHATAATSADARVRAADFPAGMGWMARLAFGLKRPRNPILGGVFAGEIAEVGKGVTGFSPGERVFGMTGARLGCYAEYQTVKATGAVAKLPDAICFTDAAALPFGFTTAIGFLRDKAKLKTGETLLVIGASGDVGSAAVQIGKQLGAHVTAVCSAANAAKVTDIGADAVVDYRTVDPFDGQHKYDVVIDTIGKNPALQVMKAVAPRGRLALVAGGLRDMLRRSGPERQKVLSGVAAERADDLDMVAGWVSAGAYKPVIDQVFPLDNIVDAHRLVATGRKVGAAVVVIG
ncbi:NAD(P)-dependent alcohol dehydrogenase [Yoonia sp. 2307UL14-13]|uniref:NAD(P)-dependent alcohol dehydrogenase n=1 Tax=Yoonia sp. 2307UL14-13 TaxID=3126506 RepID=UPI0030A66E6A